MCDEEAGKPLSLLVQLVGREGTDRPVMTMSPFTGRETPINTTRDTRLGPACSSGGCRDSVQGTYTKKQVALNTGRENDGGGKPKINFPSLSRDCREYCVWC